MHQNQYFGIGSIQLKFQSVLSYEKKLQVFIFFQRTCSGHSIMTRCLFTFFLCLTFALLIYLREVKFSWVGAVS